MAIRRFLVSCGVLFLASVAVFAQKKTEQDSLIRLLQAETAKQYNTFGMNYREVVGDQATFLHNNTYLLCDSASWNVDAGIIDAYGHVQIVQGQTRLVSENLTYIIEENLARFRGGVVELTDKDGNLLRTNQLDYNTKDSVATFHYGAAMKDIHGNVMESFSGNYDSKINTFTFENNVELYADSSFLKTDIMHYLTNEHRAYFGTETYAWRGDGFVKSAGGWYDTENRILNFNTNVFMDDPEYEAWADEVFYYQDSSFVDMKRHVQIQDPKDNIVCFTDRAQYDQKSGSAVLSDNPVMVYLGENEDHVVDTLFMRADTVLFYSVKLTDIPEQDISEASKRKEDMLYDSLAEQRAEQEKARKDAWVAEMKEYGKLPADYDPDDPDGSKKRAADNLATVAAMSDSLGVGQIDSLASNVIAADSLALKVASIDSLSSNVALDDSLSSSVAVVDSLSNVDTTMIRFVRAYNDVRMYRSDIQAKCDSLVFCELDSIARLYNKPVLWNAEKNQLTANTMQLLLQDGNVTRGAMLENAMITTQEDTVHYNQIKSVEMAGYFRDNELYRFDALGGVNAVFYLVEDENITTVNKKESRSLTAVIRNGNAEKMLYTESIKSDAYPVSQLEIANQRLDGFSWRGEERPVSRFDITDRSIFASERKNYINLRRPVYRYVNQYFDGMMQNIVNKEAVRRDNLIRKIEQESNDMKMERRMEPEEFVLE